MAIALKQRGAKFDNGSDGPSGMTLLLRATTEINYAVISQLLALGADPNRPDFRGWVPLMTAASYGDVKAASLLLAGGTDPTLTDNRGDDAETLARKQGNAQVADTIKVARQSFVPKTSSTPADPERPFQPGHLYRVIKTWHSKSWGEDFPQGKTFRYVGPGSATDPSILIFFFKGDGPGPTMSDWGIERDRIGIWREYFEDLGPANARKD